MDDATQTISQRISQKMVNYCPSQRTIGLIHQTRILLLVGVSGAGKDSIKNRLLATGNYHHIVSHTTRKPRENHGVLELDGEDYHFIDLATAEQMLDDNAFVEVKQYSGNLYGTSIAEIQLAHDKGEIAVTDLEVQGVSEYMSISETVVPLFILPPNYKEWQRRLQARYGAKGSDPIDITKRMQTAIAELKEALSKSYYYFVVNEDLNEAVKAVDNIVHREKDFTIVDKSFRVWAEQLLRELQTGT